MSFSFGWAEGLLTSTLVSDLTLQHIPFFSVPTARVEVFLVCVYTLFWIVKTHDRAAATVAVRLRQASTIFPSVAVEVARSFLDGSFYVILWVLIWGPTSGLAMFLRLALWCTIAALTICYFSATTPLNGFLWVPVWYYMVQPSCNALTRTAKTLGSKTHRWASPRVQSLLECMTTVGVAATRSVSRIVCAWVRRHRPTLGDLKKWSSSAVGVLETGLCWAACAFVDLWAGVWHSAVVASSRIASTSVELCGRVCVQIVASLHTVKSCATASIVSAYWTGCHIARRGFRAAVKTAAFFRKEPGTIECIVASAVQFLERLEMASEVLALVPFAVANDGETLQMVPPQPFREAARVAVEVALITPLHECNGNDETDVHYKAEAALMDEYHSVATVEEETAHPQCTRSTTSLTSDRASSEEVADTPLIPAASPDSSELEKDECHESIPVETATASNAGGDAHILEITAAVADERGPCDELQSDDAITIDIICPTPICNEDTFAGLANADIGSILEPTRVVTNFSGNVPVAVAKPESCKEGEAAAPIRDESLADDFEGVTLCEDTSTDELDLAGSLLRTVPAHTWDKAHASSDEESEDSADEDEDLPACKSRRNLRLPTATKTAAYTDADLEALVSGIASLALCDVGEKRVASCAGTLFVRP